MRSDNKRPMHEFAGLLPICGYIGFKVASCAARVDPKVEGAYARAGKFTAEAATSIRTLKGLTS